MKLSDNFTSEEFRCSCCKTEMMKQSFISMLQEARTIAGVPFDISSGFRCEFHNAQVGGKKGGAHPNGNAADIRCGDSITRGKILSAAREVGFTRIGISKAFIHLDNDPTKPQNVTWLY